MKIHYLGILFFGLLTTSLSAQKYDVKRYSVNEGLPSGQVYDIGFTQDGYVWFASSYGLVKSDGKNFTVLDSKNGFREEIIFDILIDSNQEFWVATSGTGVGFLQNDSLIYPQYLDTLKDKSINFMAESPNGELWFGTNGEGIYILNKTSKALEILNPKVEIQSKTIWDIYFDNDGNSWIATHAGVSVLDKERNVVFQIDENSGLNGNMAYQIFEDSNGNKWIPSNKGVTVVMPDFSSRKISSLNNTELGYVYNITEDNYGRIWIGTERKGIFWYTPNKVTHITKENGLSSNYIYRFIKDEEGAIWAATEGNGVTVFKDTRFTIFDKDSDYGSSEVYGVLKDSKGVLWFANEKGLTNYKDEKFKSFKFPKKYEGEEVWDIEELPNGNLLLLPYENPILEFDGESFSEFNFKGMDNPYYKSDIFIDDNGSILLSGEGGVIVYKNGTVDTIKVEGSNYWASYTNAIFKDSRDIYWFGTQDGIVKYNGETQVRFNSDNGVDGPSVYEIKEGPLGNIWIGTNRGVTVLTNYAGKDSIVNVRSFEIDERFSQETIFLQFDNQIGIWQGTNAGLNYFDLHTWESENAKNIHFPLQEFGKGVEFNGSASLLDDEGNLWFGTAGKGVIKFDFINRDQFPVPSKAPKAYIRQVTSNNESIDFKTSDNGLKEKITLEYDENNIDISFGASNFKAPNRILYKYRLKGFDDQFQFLENINNVYFTNLDPGKYDFEVYAKSPNSEWSKKPASLAFTIIKPFWLQWWFIILLAILVLFSIIFLIRLRIEYLEKRKLHKLVDEQTKELQNGLDEKEVLIKEIHHRVKNNLAVISGLLEMQSWTLENEEAKKALDESKLRVLAIAKIHENLYQNKNLGRIDFESFLNELKEGIVSVMHTNRDVKVEIEVRSGLIRVDQAIPCGLIINELVTNSFKHAFKDQEEKTIAIKFIEDAKYLNLSVQDNGKGVDKDLLEVTTSSLGISLIKSLSTQLDGELIVENNNGALFKLKIPNKNLVSSSI